jgi:hypothetical protein
VVSLKREERAREGNTGGPKRVRMVGRPPSFHPQRPLDNRTSRLSFASDRSSFFDAARELKLRWGMVPA